ncbi:MAG: adenylosuccinate lyase, partial [Casimicrobium sp.]
MPSLDPIIALSPLDGRYQKKVAALSDAFSEFALTRERVRVELAWLKSLAAEKGIEELPPLSANAIAFLDKIVAEFSPADALAVK